jgi:hypothetical protein
LAVSNVISSYMLSVSSRSESDKTENAGDVYL